MVDLFGFKTTVKLTSTKMSLSVNCCRCCYSAETLEKLSGSVLDVYMLICDHQGQEESNNQIASCLRCRKFLEEVHRFRINCHAIDDDLDVKSHNIDLILRNAFSENSSKIDIKVEKVDDYDGIDEIYGQINKVEVHYDPESSEQLSETLRKSEQCNSTNPTKGNLLIEQNNHRPNIMTTNKHNEDKPFSCDKKTHLNDIDMLQKCNECSFTTKNRHYLKTHIAIKHTKEKPFSCDQCNSSFKFKYILVAHQKIHLSEEDKPYKCEQCPYTTVLAASLKTHIASRHSDERPFSCDQCNYRSKRKSILNQHKKTHSTDRDKYKCNECSFKTTTMPNLKAHIACKHSDEKPYSCDLCDYRCKRKSHLNEHARIHLKDRSKSYQCNECSFRTTTMSNLRSHTSFKHSDEKPYSCDLCDFRGKSKGHIYLHMQKHATEKDN